MTEGSHACPDCGWVGNSRQALYWHRKNSLCAQRKAKTEQPAPEAPEAGTSAPPVAKVEPDAPKEPKPQKQAPSPAIEPDPEPDDDDDEEKDEKDDEKDTYFDTLLVPVIVVILIVAALVVFREKLYEFIARLREGRQPPAYGVDIVEVPAYV